jgi:uncharacterized metal-binding protein
MVVGEVGRSAVYMRYWKPYYQHIIQRSITRHRGFIMDGTFLSLLFLSWFSLAVYELRHVINYL